MKNEENNWVAAEREKVITYLQSNVEQFNEVGEWPAFHVCPHFAIWAVESKNKIGYVGFWVFSGDVPTDVIERDWNDENDNPKKALKRILNIWNNYTKHLLVGENPPGIEMGKNNKQRKELGNLLKKRVQLLTDLENKILIEEN